MIVSTNGLAVGYDGRAVTSVPDFVLNEGDRVAVTGANGTGKTTLLKTLARLLPPVTGTVTSPPQGARGSVYVHPSPFLFAGTGGENVLLGAHGDRDAARRALDMLGGLDLAGADIRTLSQGQKQRVALARALAAQPVLLLVDEPETGLDAEGLEAWGKVVTEWPGAIVVAAPEVRSPVFRTMRLR